MTPGEMNLQDVSELVTVECMYLPRDFTRQLEGTINHAPCSLVDVHITTILPSSFYGERYLESVYML